MYLFLQYLHMGTMVMVRLHLGNKPLRSGKNHCCRFYFILFFCGKSLPNGLMAAWRLLTLNAHTPPQPPPFHLPKSRSHHSQHLHLTLALGINHELQSCSIGAWFPGIRGWNKHDKRAVLSITGDDSKPRTSFSNVSIFDNCCLICAH